MKTINILIWGVSLLIFGQTAVAQFEFVENPNDGTLAVRDNGREVLVYRFGDQLKSGSAQNQIRSSYIHPLYSPEGKNLTDDFPDDHLHHHGLFWTWPGIIADEKNTQTWMPADLRQFFVRWVKREIDKDVALLEIENAWKFDNGETVARETVSLRIHASDGKSRAIDVRLTLRAIKGPIVISGSGDPNKAYGGFSFRGAPFLKGAVITTNSGELKNDSDFEKYLWVDLSAEESGVAIFVSPDHPGFPTIWCIRNSYAGFINPSWPGQNPVTLDPGNPASLAYRMYIHSGNATEGKVAEAYQDFLSRRF